MPEFRKPLFYTRARHPIYLWFLIALLGRADEVSQGANRAMRSRVLHSARSRSIIYSLSIHRQALDGMRPTLREQVLRSLVTEPLGLRAPELMLRLRPPVSQPTLWRILQGLRSEGLVTVEGRARATRYHVSERTDLSTLRSRRLHRGAAQRLAGDPSLRELARERLQKLRHVNPHGRVYHDRWAALLDGPLAQLLQTMTEVSEQSDALRRESPCTVLVTADERRRVFKAIRAA